MSSFKPGTVCIGYAHGGVVENAFMESIMGILCGPSRDRIVDVKGAEGLYVDDNRERLARHFMRMQVEWFWFVDTDMSFAPDTLELLLACSHPEEKPIMSALYFGYMNNGELVPIWYGREADGRISHLRSFRSGVQQLGVVGMGCCLIHRSVFEKFGDRFAKTGYLYFGRDRAPWTPQPAIDNDFTTFGEDNCFCWRAEQLGIPVHGNGDIVVEHRKKRYESLGTFLATYQQKQIAQEAGQAKLTLLRKAEDSGARNEAHAEAFRTGSAAEYGAAGNPAGGGESAHQGNLSAGTPGVVEPNHAGQQPGSQSRRDLGLGEPAAALFGRLRG